MIAYGFAAFILAGTGYAAYLDLKTSEVPDAVSYLVAGGSLIFYAYRSIVMGSFDPLIGSVVTGLGLFAVGWAMYLAGMWGGADAFVLGASGFAIPELFSVLGAPYIPPWPVSVSFVFTVFLLGAVYSFLYAGFKAFSSDGFLDSLKNEFQERRRIYSLVFLASSGVMAAFTVSAHVSFGLPLLITVKNLTASLLLLAALLGVALFLRTVEERVLRRDIPVKELEEGDVIGDDLDLGTEETGDGIRAAMKRAAISVSPFHVSKDAASRISGLSQEQVEYLQETRETVEVREGVRFIPVFPVALLLLMVLGDPLYFAVLQAV